MRKSARRYAAAGDELVMRNRAKLARWLPRAMTESSIDRDMCGGYDVSPALLGVRQISREFFRR
jgi:hypothetical protein